MHPRSHTLCNTKLTLLLQTYKLDGPMHRFCIFVTFEMQKSVQTAIANTYNPNLHSSLNYQTAH